MTRGPKPTGDAGSPPCLAAEIAPDYFDPLGVDARQAADVARWRKARRGELLLARAALSIADRQSAAARIGDHLDRLLEDRFPDLSGKVISGYWPIKSEPDLRGWMARCLALGASLALPEVEETNRPLVFRPWRPGAAMRRGHWNIPVPDTTETLTPDIVLAPLVGWDAGGYRLGYGGGYFDRTLARIHPFAIGVGLSAGRLASIYPQPHDVGLGAIVTDGGIDYLRGA